MPNGSFSRRRRRTGRPVPPEGGWRRARPHRAACHSCRMAGMGRWARRLAGATLIAGAGAAVAWTAKGVRAEFGGQRTATSGERVRRSPQFRDGVFHNADSGATAVVDPRSGAAMLREAVFGKQRRRPRDPVPLATPAAGPQAVEGVQITWYGHASALVELDGA